LIAQKSAENREKSANDTHSQLRSGGPFAIHAREPGTFFIDDFGCEVEASAAFRLGPEARISGARAARSEAGGGADIGFPNQIAAAHDHGDFPYSILRCIRK
jgi:hypothetical protein